MFKTNPLISNVTITSKLLKIDNVLINVVVVVTTCSQQSEQHVFKETELGKAKGAEDQRQEEHLWDSFIKIVKQLQIGGTDKQPTIINEELLCSNSVGLLNNSTTTQSNKKN
jgi:hypothetical protein